MMKLLLSLMPDMSMIQMDFGGCLHIHALHQQSHVVVKVPVHFPDKQPVYFQEGQDEVAAPESTNIYTMLTV